MIDGGARRDRTADLLHAMQALSQLSYSPAKEYRSLMRHLVAVKIFFSQQGFFSRLAETPATLIL